MLIQMDGSYHPWLGDQAPPFTLLIAVDDATGQVVSAWFSEHEDARSYFLLIPRLGGASRRARGPLHRSPRRVQAHAGTRPPCRAHPVQPGHG